MSFTKLPLMGKGGKPKTRHKENGDGDNTNTIGV